MQPLHKPEGASDARISVVRTIFGWKCTRCTTEFDGCGQYLGVRRVGVAMVPDGNPKKLEPMIVARR